MSKVLGKQECWLFLSCVALGPECETCCSRMKRCKKNYLACFKLARSESTEALSKQKPGMEEEDSLGRLMSVQGKNVVDCSSLRHSSPGMSQTELPREFVAHHTVQSSVESCRLGAKLAETRLLSLTHTHTHTREGGIRCVIRCELFDDNSRKLGSRDLGF
ncbi:hypothetical protein RRG08_020605 [Elysia crispata]|uniref:Uncharacterized protein n=1 Tax=Elysia crispata TaxID=231223 RepID=A0AAE0ZGR3_9GAST|nr:hypothetical protein RRG08_020605 [Elysia crispata]